MDDARRGFFPLVTGDDVSVSQAGALVVFARNDLELDQGGSRWLGAGNDLSVSQGGAFIAGAGNRVSIDRGGSLLAAARTVRAERSFVGLAIGPSVDISDDSTTVVGSGGSFLAGLALGVVVTALARLLRS